MFPLFFEEEIIIQLTACILTYNRYDYLRRCVASALRYCNRIIVVDGAFADYPHKIPYSTDHTKDIALVPEVELITTDKAWRTEAEKRNAYLSLLCNNEWFIYLDDDEQLVELDWDKVKGDMALLEIEIGERKPRAPRLIKYKRGLMYATHYIVEYKGNHIDISFNQHGKVLAGKIKATPTPKTDSYVKWKKEQKKDEELTKKKLIMSGKLKDISHYKGGE